MEPEKERKKQTNKLRREGEVRSTKKESGQGVGHEQTKKQTNTQTNKETKKQKTNKETNKRTKNKQTNKQTKLSCQGVGIFGRSGCCL